MLKYGCGIWLCLVLFITAAYAPPAYATSASIVITHIQAGGAGAALEELVVLYNNSSEDIDISRWCLKNKTGASFACFGSSDPTRARYLPAYSYTSAASTALAATLQFDGFTVTYLPISQSSGSIVGGADTVSLVDATSQVIDQHSWTTSLVGGMAYARQAVAGSFPGTYVDTDQPADWVIAPSHFIPDDQTELRPVEDVCPHLDGIQSQLPEGYVFGGAEGDCLPRLLPLKLSELLPNAAGSDDGQEFLEIYNPNEIDVLLERYYFLIGPELDQLVSFPSGAYVPAMSYLSFSNAELSFNLVNTSGRVRLAGDEETFDETAYENPKDGASWALIEGVWRYVGHPTPGEPNLLAAPAAPEGKPETAVKPCAPGQYRHPETNRCRKLVVADDTPAACAEGQERNPETNRCRKVTTAPTMPAPCKEGQERNPETNRCRKKVEMSEVGYAVLGAETGGESNWYTWILIAMLIIAAATYAVWEWRQELRALIVRLRRVRPKRK